MRRRGRIVVWPIYLDSGFPRRVGRRLPLALAMRDVKAEEIYEAASKLNLNPVLVADSAYPKMPWRRVGLVLVDKNRPKTKLLRELAERMRSIRKKRRI